MSPYNDWFKHEIAGLVWEYDIPVHDLKLAYMYWTKRNRDNCNAYSFLSRAQYICEQYAFEADEDREANFATYFVANSSYIDKWYLRGLPGYDQKEAVCH